MKKSARSSSLHKAKREEAQHDVVKLKRENESEQDDSEVYTNAHGLNIQIKEEPRSQEICEEHNDRDASRCLDTKPDTVASRSKDQHQQGHVKDECDSDRSEDEVTGAAVKEESESWIKVDEDIKEEPEDPDNIQEYNEEGDELCKGTL